MNRILILLSLSLVGCNSLKKLTTGDEGTPPPPITVISSNPALGSTPDFGVTLDADRTRQTVHVKADASGLVSVPLVPSDRLHVFIRDVGTWFKIGPLYSNAYYYQRSIEGVRLIGPAVGGKELVVYIDRLN